MSDEVLTGHLAEFYLADSNGQLQECIGLTEIPLPAGGKALLETSDLKTQGYKTWMKEPLADGESPELAGKYYPGSATDLLMIDAKADNHPRAFKIRIPIDDVATGYHTFAGEVLVLDYKRESQTTNKVRMFKLPIKWSGEIVEDVE